MKVLAIDTATPYLVLGTNRAERALWRGRRHAETLLADLETFLAEQNLERADLDLIVVGEGPGSYTGLRVAAAAGLGLSRALGLPMVGAATLAAVAARGRGLVRPVLSARSGHVYTALYRVDDALEELREPEKLAFSELPHDACLVFDAPPSGSALARLGASAYENGKRGLETVYL